MCSCGGTSEFRTIHRHHPLGSTFYLARTMEHLKYLSRQGIIHTVLLNEIQAGSPVSALGLQTSRVQVYLAQPLPPGQSRVRAGSEPGQSRVRSSAATVCTSVYDQAVVNILGLPDVHV